MGSPEVLATRLTLEMEKMPYLHGDSFQGKKDIKDVIAYVV